MLLLLIVENFIAGSLNGQFKILSVSFGTLTGGNTCILGSAWFFSITVNRVIYG